jgi:hypothetical protein
MHLTSESVPRSAFITVTDDMELDFDFESCFDPPPSEGDETRMLDDSCFLDVDFDCRDGPSADIAQDLEDRSSSSDNDDLETSSEFNCSATCACALC